MSSPDTPIPAPVEAAEAAAGEASGRSIIGCNFRTAGRLSNEDARTLTAFYESFARSLEDALETCLGSEVAFKLQVLERIPISEYAASIPESAYVVPLALTRQPCGMLVQCESTLVLPILELLMGGSATGPSASRELTEIDSEILQDVFEVIARQIELSWKMPALSIAVGQSIAPAHADQFCAPNDKVTLINYQVSLGGISGTVQFVLPSIALGTLMKQIEQDKPTTRGNVRFFPTPSIRERVLDCEMEVAAELSNLRVTVRDLVALQPGSVLKLRAPVQTPGMLTAGGRSMFEAIPVRNGSQRAAQLGRKTQANDWK